MCSRSGGMASIKDRGGFSYTKDGKTRTFEYRNGKVYDVSDAGAIPEQLNTSLSVSELVQRAQKNADRVDILSPAQMQQRRDERNADRESRKNIDYELGTGVPWGNRQYRQVARRNRLITRGMKRARG